MVQSCSVGNCTVRRISDVKFHRFPKNPILRKRWIIALKRDNYQPSSTAVICSNHFLEDDYEINVHGNKVLKRDVVPSIFNHPKQLKREVKPQRILRRTTTIYNEASATGCQLDRLNNIDPLKTEPSPQKLTLEAHDQPSCSNNSSVKNQIQNKKSETIFKGRFEAVYIENFTEEDLECPRKRKRKKISREVYIGGANDSDLQSPKRAKITFKIATSKVEEKTRKLRTAQMVIRRLKAKIANLKTFSNYSKENDYIFDSAEQIIEASVPGQVGKIINRTLRGPTRQKYSSLRSFALTLNFYSPRAYKFGRKTFNIHQ